VVKLIIEGIVEQKRRRGRSETSNPGQDQSQKVLYYTMY